MAKTVKAVKQSNKATAIKRGALNTFTTAKANVIKANALLDKAIESDEKSILDVERKITELEKETAQKVDDMFNQIDVLQSRKLSLQTEKAANNVLIENLEKFTV